MNNKENMAHKHEEFEEIQASIQKLTEEELAADASRATGACCLTGIGYQQCFNGTTYKACNDAAYAQGLAFSWHTGKSCSQIDCPKK